MAAVAAAGSLQSHLHGPHSLGAIGTLTKRSGSVPGNARGTACSNETDAVPLFKKHLEATEEKLSVQIGRVQQQNEKLREAAFSRVDAKLCGFEALQPKIDRRLAELSGNFQGLSSEVQVQIRRVDQMDSRLRSWKQELEDISDPGGLSSASKAKAMKTMEKAKFKAQKITSKAHSEQFILRTTRHPFVVQLHFAFQCSYFWALVMEYCPNGDLQGCLVKHGTPGLLLEDAARFAGEVLLALEHLHGIRVIFRDLKLENVVIDSNWRAKVTDFGLAKKLYTASDANTMCGSYGYAAPEIMMSKGRYTMAVDLYSYGVMLYMLTSGGETSLRNPAQKNRLPPKTHGQLKKKLRDSEKDMTLQWARAESLVMPLLKMLLSEDPLERSSSTDLKSNPVFAKHLKEPVDALLEKGPCCAPKTVAPH